jgi:hypothetical protein
MSIRRRFLLAASTAAVAALCVSQAQAWGWGGERVKGNGDVTSESREAGSFDAVSLTGGFDVVIRQGAGTKVEIRADRNLLPYLETRVNEGSKGRTLEIGPKRGFEPVGSVTPVVTIEMPSLRAAAVAGSGKIKVEPIASVSLDASIAGSGDIQLNNVKADKLSLRVSGSGDIVATGSSAALHVSVAGSGDVKAAGLVAEEVKVSIAGSGDAQVQASKKLNVSIAGSGDVRYAGSPEISSSIAGSGSVKRMKD